GGGGGGYSGSSGYGRQRNWRKRIKWTLIVVLVLIVGVGGGTYLWANSKLNHDNSVLADYSGRPAKGSGTNYLIVGSDSRQGMTKDQEKQWHTGAAAGGRTDSMMILHTGSNGTTMLSIPRDSWVTIPAFTGKSGKHYPATKNKINASFSWGGSQLLARTVEYNTGLHIDHYSEVGFGGFVQIVNSLGGVTMCFDKAVKDTDSGADFQPGCHKLNGAQSLAFVRQRHQMADQDLGRMRNQQKFLSTVAHQAASPSTVLNPFKLYPVLGSGLDMLTVDKDMSLINLGQMFFAMKGVTSGDGKSMTVPIATANYQTGSVGVAVLWDKAKCKTLFDELKNDQKVTVSSGSQ
ncbi:transcriptional regulator, partial [Mangrovactinospora gilvigrisea]